MGLYRWSLQGLLLVSFIAAGYFFTNQSAWIGALVLLAYPLITLLLAMDFPRDVWFQKIAGFYDQHVLPLLVRYGQGLLLCLTAVLFLMGQGTILASLKLQQLEAFHRQLFLGGLLCLLGLIPAFYYALKKSGTRLALGSHGFTLVLTLFGLAFCAWAGALIYRSSVDMGSAGRYYCLFDDAMVSMRYAWNLAHGLGLTWNPGEHVEGYTNLLMTLYMAIGAWLLNKNLAVLFVQSSGLVFMLLIAFCHLKISKHLMPSVDLKKQELYAFLAFLSPLLYYPMTFWSIMGMETGLLTLLICASLLLAFQDSVNPRFNPWLGITLGLTTLVRPDALVQVALIFVYRLYTVLKARKNILGLLGEMAVAAFFPVGQLAFRLAYYQDWVPNTYRLKIEGFPLASRLAHGQIFLFKFMQSAWLVSLLGLGSLFLNYRKEKLLIVALFTSVNIYQLLVGGDPWVYWRIMAPYVPLMLMLGLLGLSDLSQRVITYFRASQSSQLAVVGTQHALLLFVWVALLAGLNKEFLPEMYFRELPYSVFYNASNVRTGLGLEKLLKPGARVGVLWAGAIPYYSGALAIDFLGKCDKHIARLAAIPQEMPGHNKHNLQYSIRQLEPDFVQQYYWQGDTQQEFVEANYLMYGNCWYRKNSSKINWDLMKL
jgi:hypothetical protein